MKKAIQDPEESFFEVEEILQKKLVNGQTMYRVKWKGYPLSQSSWEPLENLDQVMDMIEEFDAASQQSEDEVRRSKGRKKSQKPEKPRTEAAPEVPTKVVTVKEDRGNLVWTVEFESGRTEVRPLEQLRNETPQILISFLLSKIKFV